MGGRREAEYDWVDRGVGAESDVAQVWTGGGNHFAFWESEFYNRSVGPVYALSQPFDSFGQRMASTKPDGRVEYLGRPLRLRYALTDIWTKLRGEVIVRNELTGMAAYRVDGPLVVVEQLQGLYPDRWTGSYAIYRRNDCAGGSLLLDFETNPVLHPKRFAVSVFQNGVAAGKLSVPARPTDKALSIPLRPRDGSCEVSLGIPTASATRETPGDLRQLGLRISSARYVRSRLSLELGDPASELVVFELELAQGIHDRVLELALARGVRAEKPKQQPAIGEPEPSEARWLRPACAGHARGTPLPAARVSRSTDAPSSALVARGRAQRGTRRCEQLSGS